jgi:hypothetical protein
MFHKEIKDAEEKRTNLFYGYSYSLNCKNSNKNTNDDPEKLNDFITNLMDPFANYNYKSKINTANNNKALYYDDYRILYDIDSINS